MTVVTADFKLLAGKRTVFVVAASEGLGVEPEARGSVERSTVSPALLVIGVQLGHDIGAFPLEPLPSFLSLFVEDSVEGRLGDNETTSTAAVARLDDGK
jgi:hypothetical protein